MGEYKRNKEGLYQCPCCELFTIGEPEGWEICDNCNWEDDRLQKDKPEYAGGANKMSLNEARKAYREGKKVI